MSILSHVCRYLFWTKAKREYSMQCIISGFWFLLTKKKGTGYIVYCFTCFKMNNWVLSDVYGSFFFFLTYRSNTFFVLKYFWPSLRVCWHKLFYDKLGILRYLLIFIWIFYSIITDYSVIYHNTWHLPSILHNIWGFAKSQIFKKK